MIEYEIKSAGSDREIRIATTGEDSLGPFSIYYCQYDFLKPGTDRAITVPHL